MNPLMTVGQQVFNWTWKTSFQAAILVALVLLLQRLLSRWLTPRMRYALSLLVVCRLLLPVAPSSSLSLENLFARTTQPVQSAVIATAVPSPVHESSPRIHPAGFPLAAVLGVGWFCGLIVLICVAGWQYRTWRRFIRAGKHLADLRLIEILDAARKAMGVRRPVTLVSVAQLSSPAVFGFWRVRLLLPKSALPVLSEQEWRLIFMHEMAHVRRNDMFLNVFLIAVQFLHWFNPLVWLGLHRLRADRELVCDRMVLKRLEPGDHLGYAQVLLKLAEAISYGPQAFAGAIPVVGNKSEIKRRILMIKYYREPGRMAGFVTIILVFALGCLTFTRAREGEPDATALAPGTKPLVIFIDAKGNLKFGKQQRPITSEQLKTELVSAARRNPELKLSVSVDKDAPSSQVVKVMGAAREAKISSTGFQTEEAGPTYEEVVLRRNDVLTATNGAMVTYGQTVLTADRIEVYPEQGQVVAVGHVQLQQGGQRWTSEHLAYNFLTNQIPSPAGVAGIGIRYLGPQLVEEGDIRARIRVQAGKSYNPADVDDDVRSLYATGLFYNVRVSSESTHEGIKITYIVQCNPRLLELKFTGNSKFSDAELRKRISSKIGGPFNDRKLFQDSQTIQDMYERAGYKGTVVKSSHETDIESGKATATFVITEHP
jgi:beta-lactamase regulating signal transducer with metallopeptidase domain